jgi:hypothetical protein
MKFIIGFSTYPRANGSTFSLLSRTVQSIIANQDLRDHTLKFIVVGDDYPNMEQELSPIFTGFDVEMYNISENDALRNKKNVPNEVKWYYCSMRNLTLNWEKALEYSDEYDYFILSDDDEEYLNYFILNQAAYIEKYNYPDLTFSAGITACGQIYPPQPLPFPCPHLVFKSGMAYNIKNGDFIRDLIEFSKQVWIKLESCITRNSFENEGLFCGDAQLWEYLIPKFQNNIYRALFIPEILINHYTQGSMLQELDN